VFIIISPTKRGEVTRDESDDILESLCDGVCVGVWSDDIFGHLVAECDYIEFDYLEMETELMYVLIVEWGVGLADDQTAACRSVSPYRRLLQSAILHTKELCCIYISQCSVIDSSSSVVWLFVLCKLEFFSEFMLYAMFSA